MAPTPVTVLSGFLGSGKTTLLNNLLANSAGRRLAVIVNDFSEVNVDADLIAAGTHLSRGSEELVELSNGCICCTLREDLISSVADLARSGRFDQIVIESTGISEPMPVAATFDWTFDDGFRLGDLAPLDTMVTLVDASQFLTEMRRGRALAEGDPSAEADDTRTIADLLVDQVEYADLLLVTKTDLVDEDIAVAVEQAVKAMNPTARILRVTDGQVGVAAILDARLHDPDADDRAAFAAELARPHIPESEEYRISSAVFRADRPFHRGRLLDALRGTVGLVRSKGRCWLADRPEYVQEWSQAGPNLSIRPVANWSQVSVPPSTELVLIGVRFDDASAIDALTNALVTDQEVVDLLGAGLTP